MTHSSGISVTLTSHIELSSVTDRILLYVFHHHAAHRPTMNACLVDISFSALLDDFTVRTAVESTETILFSSLRGSGSGAGSFIVVLKLSIFTHVRFATSFHAK
uniref:Uncharacterized protein n=1 Tax=Ascaris lumbricoides TaxID=6252 RepID=A0A0M3HTP3_ASCLU